MNISFETFLGSLIGIGFKSLRNRLRAPDRTLLYFAGHYGSQPYHAQGLEQRGETVVALREPGSTPVGEEIRELHLFIAQYCGYPRAAAMVGPMEEAIAEASADAGSSQEDKG